MQGFILPLNIIIVGALVSITMYFYLVYSKKEKYSMEKLFLNYYETAAIVLFGVGFVTLLLNNNLIKKIIGFKHNGYCSFFLFFYCKGIMEKKLQL